MNTLRDTVAVIVFFGICIALVHCGAGEVELTEPPVFLSQDAELMRECLRDALAIVKAQKEYLTRDAELTAAAIIAVPLFEHRIVRKNQE